MLLERRELLLAAGATTLHGCSPAVNIPPSLPPASSSARPSVDVHCHVFNSRDVPVRQFVELVYLDKFPFGNIADPLLAFICQVMTFDTPTTQDELDELQGGEVTMAARVRLNRTDRKTAAVANAIDHMLAGDTSFDHQTSPERTESLRVNPANRAWMIQRLPRARRQRVLRRLTPHAFKAPSGLDLTVEAQSLITQSQFQTWIDFAYNYTLARWELTDHLASLSAVQTAEVGLYTPALLDIGRWVGDLQTSDIGPQIDIMELISARPGKSYAVHAFVPFDPWRAIADDTLLPTIQAAIEQKGCLGVKLYPPMGFKPIGNDIATFPPSLRPPHPNGAALVDQQMLALLDYCLLKDVPVMAHCSYSQFISAPGGQCANPLNWKTYLDSTAARRGLRLNLAHFGGPWDTNGWTETVAAMLGGYPNLYSDIADASFVLNDPSTAAANKIILDRVAKLLSSFQPDGPNARSRIMYGSDWSLLAREQNSSAYYGQMKTVFCDRVGFTPAERQGFLGRTALAFLGLSKAADGSSPMPRQRLEAFRRARKLDGSLFDRIDAVSA